MRQALEKVHHLLPVVIFQSTCQRTGPVWAHTHDTDVRISGCLEGGWGDNNSQYRFTEKLSVGMRL